MLAIFRPWRTGADLKKQNETWHDSFESYDFSMQHRTYIKNMNLRYECLDARDDFRAQLLAGKVTEMPSFPAAFDTSLLTRQMPPAEFIDLPNPDEDVESVVLYDPELGMKKGKKYLARERSMASVSEVLRAAGWTDLPSSAPKCVIPVASLPHKTPEHWNKVLLVERHSLLEERRKQAGTPASTVTSGPLQKFRENVVEICDKSFFDKLGIEYGSIKKLTSDIVTECKLNDEQERAFRIVAQHTTGCAGLALKMYVGGMAGTGKSRVVKALIKFFSRQVMQYAIVTVAPTGTAAALLGGSTYHYMLGFGGRSEEVKCATMSQVVARLDGIRYLVLDEVSMLGCTDMYKISDRLCKARNQLIEAFGGMNMLFAGDFAQLTPIGGENVSLYSRTVGTPDKATTFNGHCASIGKAVWHQVTVVVILRKNMRDTGVTKRDIQYRTALENMRYKACTREDLIFLNSLVSSRLPGRHFLGADPWRHAPIIVGDNTQKDEINRLGCLRFAAETGQSLCHFYCEDFIAPKPEGKAATTTKFKASKTSVLNTMSMHLQEVLWSQPAACHEHRAPPVLSLCYHLPVVIRHNIATELCVTKGQRGTVYGWQSSIGRFGKEELDVLFVLLDDPPSTVNLPGLPPNVVPVLKRKSAGYVYLPDDTKIFVSRNQVDVLPGFSMTCHAAQGASFEVNAPDINTLDTHQSCYTALSRSRSVAKTVIVQGFDSNRMTGGASGALRREFRELELLDEITRLRYEGKLHPSVIGNTRMMLIETFLAWKGTDYQPRAVHSSLRSTLKDPYILDSFPPVPWASMDKKQYNELTKNKHAKLLDNNKVSETGLPVTSETPLDHVPATDPTKPHSGTKRNVSALYPDGDIVAPPSTRAKRDSPVGTSRKASQHRNRSPSLPLYRPAPAPVGVVWSNNSCAFDCILPILRDVWSNAPLHWQHVFERNSMDLMSQLITGFVLHSQSLASMEDIREDLRRTMHVLRPDEFPVGGYCSATTLLAAVLHTSTTIFQVNHVCPSCGFCTNRRGRFKQFLLEDPTHSVRSVSQWFAEPPSRETTVRCSGCPGSLFKVFTHLTTPPIMAFAYYQRPDLCIDITFTRTIHGQPATYALRGVIYYSVTWKHYISRIVTADSRVWRHDGMDLGGLPALEFDHPSMGNMTSCGDSYEATTLIYVRIA